MVDGGLALDGAESYVSTVPLTKDLRAKTLEVWLRLAQLQQAGGGAIGVQKLDGSVFDAIVFGEREPGTLDGRQQQFLARTQSFGGPVEVAADKELVHLAIVYSEDGTSPLTAMASLRQTVHHDRPVTYKAGERKS